MKITHQLTNITSEPFSNHHVRRLIDKYIRKLNEYNVTNGFKQSILGIDPFARCSFTTDLDWFVTNDINEDMPTHYHLEATDFAQLMYETRSKQIIDICLFDPPYTLRLLKDHYMDDNNKMEETIPLWQTNNMWGKCKDYLAHLIEIGGYVISFGYHSHGFGKHRGFEKKEILILEQAGSPDRYDLLVTVEQKVQKSLDDWVTSEEE